MYGSSPEEWSPSAYQRVVIVTRALAQFALGNDSRRHVSTRPFVTVCIRPTKPAYLFRVCKRPAPDAFRSCEGSRFEVRTARLLFETRTGTTGPTDPTELHRPLVIRHHQHTGKGPIASDRDDKRQLRQVVGGEFRLPRSGFWCSSSATLARRTTLQQLRVGRSRTKKLKCPLKGR